MIFKQLRNSDSLVGMHISTFPLTFMFYSDKTDSFVGFSGQPLGLTTFSCLPGNDTFHFEDVKRGKEASHNLGVRMNAKPEHRPSLKRKT